MTGRPKDPEEALEDDLRALLPRVDPVPERVLEQARRSLGALVPGWLLMEITYDSVLDLSLGRFVPQESVRLMSFGGEGLRLDLRIKGRGAGVLLAGWTAPVNARTVALETERESFALRVDSDGEFRAQEIAHGRVRLHIAAECADGLRNFQTSWFRC